MVKGYEQEILRLKSLIRKGYASLLFTQVNREIYAKIPHNDQVGQICTNLLSQRIGNS